MKTEEVHAGNAWPGHPACGASGRLARCVKDTAGEVGHWHTEVSHLG